MNYEKVKKEKGKENGETKTVGNLEDQGIKVCVWL